MRVSKINNYERSNFQNKQQIKSNGNNNSASNIPFGAKLHVDGNVLDSVILGYSPELYGCSRNAFINKFCNFVNQLGKKVKPLHPVDAPLFLKVPLDWTMNLYYAQKGFCELKGNRLSLETENPKQGVVYQFSYDPNKTELLDNLHDAAENLLTLNS